MKASDPLAYKLVPLTRGLFAAVSPEDYERVMEHNWRSQLSRYGRVDAVVSRSLVSRTRYMRLQNFVLGFDKLPVNTVVDHWNRNVFDCRRANLRLCTPQQNACNCSHKIGWSGYIGVQQTPSGKFEARITQGRKHFNLGTFLIAEEAARVRDAAARAQFGEFSIFNFPNPDEIPPAVPIEIQYQKMLAVSGRVQRGRIGGTSKYTGVSRGLSYNKYRWHIANGGVKLSRCGFPTELSAAIAREKYIIEHNLPNYRNFPDGIPKDEIPLPPSYPALP
jgi:hypothetical protein